MMKRRLMTLFVMAITPFIGNASADCAGLVNANGARLTSQSGASAPSEQDMAALQSAFMLLADAKTNCDQGDETGSVAILDQLNGLLTSLGR